MKKYLAALLTALLLLCMALSAGAVGPALTATEAYCILDADTGLVLAQQNMNEELHPASITKVMTLGLACQKAQGNWDGVKLTVSHEDVYSLAGTDSSHIALQEGEEVPLQDALYGTMIAILAWLKRLGLINWTGRIKVVNACLLTVAAAMLLPYSGDRHTLLWCMGGGAAVLAAAWIIGRLHLPRIVLWLILLTFLVLMDTGLVGL